MQYTLKRELLREIESLDNVEDEELCDVAAEWLDSIVNYVENAIVRYEGYTLNLTRIKSYPECDYITFALLRKNNEGITDFAKGISASEVLKLFFEKKLKVEVVRDLYDTVWDDIN